MTDANIYNELNAAYRLLRDCEIVFRYLGYKGDDYSLKHELRSLAQRLEDGSFSRAKDAINEAAANTRAAAGAEPDRGLQTPRRMAAVELLQSQGWQWNDGKWEHPAPGGEVGLSERAMADLQASLSYASTVNGWPCYSVPLRTVHELILANPTPGGAREVTEAAVIELVSGPFMYHHKMNELQERYAQGFDRCRELTLENVKVFFAIRAAAPQAGG